MLIKTFLFSLFISASCACPDLWIAMGNSCYMVSTEPMDFYAAEQYCHDEGGYMVEVNDEDEQASFLSFLSFEMDYWLGMTDFAEEGVWVWQNSYQPVDYTYWYSDQPDNGAGYGDEDCAIMSAWDHLQWHDFDCNWQNYGDSYFHALCETENV